MLETVSDRPSSIFEQITLSGKYNDTLLNYKESKDLTDKKEHTLSSLWIMQVKRAHPIKSNYNVK